MSVKKTLKKVIERNNTGIGKGFNLFIISLIVLSVLSLSIETLPDLSPDFIRALLIVEYIIVAIFSVEYLLRIFVADKKLHYIFSFYGIIDFLAIVPFYLAVSVDLRSIRIFRLLRLFRIFKLARFSDAATRLLYAFKSVRAELVIYSMIMICTLYISAVVIYYFENPAQPEVFSTVFHSIWWSVSTITLLGYGDIYPVTTGGRIFTFVILMIGIALISVFTALISSALKNPIEE